MVDQNDQKRWAENPPWKNLPMFDRGRTMVETRLTVPLIDTYSLLTNASHLASLSSSSSKLATAAGAGRWMLHLFKNKIHFVDQEGWAKPPLEDPTHD